MNEENDFEGNEEIEYYNQFDLLKNPIEINAQNGRVLVSAKSHWGKTYLIQNLLLNFKDKGYNVQILSYTKESEKDYWEKLEKAGCEITYADMTDYKTLMNFFFSIKANSVIYVDDLDLYLNDQADNLKDAINIIKDFFSASRKANIITIYSVKSLKGAPWTTFTEMAEVLFIGKFNRFSSAWNSFGINDLEYKMDNLPSHAFIMKSDEGVSLVKAEDEGIIDLAEYNIDLYNEKEEKIAKEEQEEEEREEKRKEIEKENLLKKIKEASKNLEYSKLLLKEYSEMKNKDSYILNSIDNFEDYKSNEIEEISKLNAEATRLQINYLDIQTAINNGIKDEDTEYEEEKKKEKIEEIKEEQKRIDEKENEKKMSNILKAKAMNDEKENIYKNRKYITFYKLQIYLLFLVGVLFSFTSIYIWLILIPIIFLFYRKDKAEEKELINYQNKLIDLGKAYPNNGRLSKNQEEYELNYTSINSKSYYIYDKASQKLIKKEPNPEYIGKLKYKVNLTKSTVKIAGVFYIYQFILFLLLSVISLNATLAFASGLTVIGLVILISYFIGNLIANLSAKLFAITLFEILFGLLAVLYLSYLILPIIIAIILSLIQINKHG